MPGARRFAPTVWLLGWASLFTDAATEMIYPLLPVYLSAVLGASAVSLGIVEGVAEAVNSVLKVASGHWSDRLGRRKPIVVAGYALSSAARPFIAITGSWLQVLAIRAIDRTGKGIRGAPRDAILAQAAAPGDRGRVFGFHRSMDHTGAIVGPLLATGILFFAPANYRLVFALSAIPGAIAVWLLFRVKEGVAVSGFSRTIPDGPPKGGHYDSGSRRSLTVYFFVLMLFSLGNSADAFLLLRLTDALGGATFVPLLWAGLHVVKASLSTWGGALSDRWGRRQTIVTGWGVYAAVYLGFALSSSATAFIGWFLLYGVYFALTEGAEKALVADLAPAARSGTAFGYYNATLGVGSLMASVMFGVIFERIGPAAAFGTGAALAACASVLLLIVVPAPDAKIDGSDAPDSRNQ